MSISPAFIKLLAEELRIKTESIPVDELTAWTQKAMEQLINSAHKDRSLLDATIQKMAKRLKELGETNANLKEEIEELRQEARRDVLLDVGNQRALEDKIGSMEWQGGNGLIEHPLTIAFLDINDFKEFNNKKGRSAGDTALKHFRDTLCAEFRDTDIFRRGSEGADEFVIIVEKMDAAEMKKRLTEVNASLAKRPFKIEGLPPLSFSYGIHQLTPGQPIQAAVHQAENEMDERKREYKNLRKSTSNPVISPQSPIAPKSIKPGDIERGDVGPGSP